MNSEGLNSEVLDNDLPQAEVVAETPVVETPPPAPIPSLDDSSLYIHRELSVSYTPLVARALSAR